MTTGLLQQIELLFGSVGVILGLFFSFYLLFNYKNHPISGLFLGFYLLAFSIRIGKSVFHHFFTIDPVIRNYLLAVLFCVGPSLWLYTKYLHQPYIKPTVAILWHYTPFFLILPICWLIPNNPGDFSIYFALFYNAISAHMLGYCLLSIVWFYHRAKQGNYDKHEKERSWLTYFLWGNFAMLVTYILISTLIIPFYLGLSFLFSVMVILFSVMALKNPELFRMPKQKYRNSRLGDSEVIDIMQKLRAVMVDGKPYLDPSLSQAMLSEKVGVSINHLSQAINQNEGLNFSQFISKYRIDEAKNLLLANSHRHYTIATVAYESGFNSISSFNTTFKKITGTTPIAFRKSANR
ncbi:helix-turn-helix domain-containing protein [uncultured Croceitalea sp.]|uniref:AraC family transcriptional regulator n=1 Tax=uncultured Croceitalea sp. TaxID=1798908 RepID=UPI0033059C12